MGTYLLLFAVLSPRGKAGRGESIGKGVLAAISCRIPRLAMERDLWIAAVFN
jgi:hypothetical protein